MSLLGGAAGETAQRIIATAHRILQAGEQDGASL
jgi:hypothetical protein